MESGMRRGLWLGRMSRRLKNRQNVFRVVFGLYTSALLTATHWPGLVVDGPIDRTDLVIHAGVFFWWTVLLFGSGLVAMGGCGCFARRLVWTGVCGVVFAGFDELTQPMFSRVADPLDFLADSVGVLAAAGAIWVWWRRRGGDGNGQWAVGNGGEGGEGGEEFKTPSVRGGADTSAGSPGEEKECRGEEEEGE